MPNDEGKAVRGRIALPKRFARNVLTASSGFAKLWECVRVLAPLFRDIAYFRTAFPIQKSSGTLI
jgi:hypothetical protein